MTTSAAIWFKCQLRPKKVANMPQLMRFLILVAPVALSLPLPPLPDLAGLVEIATVATVDATKGVFHGSWNFSGTWHNTTVVQPTVLLPTVEQLKQMPRSESEERAHWFFSAFVLVFLVVVSVGTLILHFGPQLKSSSRSTYRTLSLEEGSAVSSSSQFLSSDRQKCLGAVSFGATFMVSLGAVVWSLETGRLSKSTGLDWEIYLLLFSLVGVWQLVQAVGAVALIDPNDCFERSTFGMASFLSMTPFLSDFFDSLKDVIFGGLCMQSEHAVLQIVGVVSWIYLLVIHVFFFNSPNSLAELTGTYLSVLIATPKPRSDSSPMSFRETVLLALYKQTTPTKRKLLLIENVPQALFSLLFLYYEGSSGGSPFVTIMNLIVPCAQIAGAFVLFNLLLSAVAAALAKKLDRAMAFGNFVVARQLFDEAGRSCVGWGHFFFALPETEHPPLVRC